MARAGEQAKNFRTVAPAARPVVLGARAANGGGRRTTSISGGKVVIGGSERTLRPKGHGR